VEAIPENKLNEEGEKTNPEGTVGDAEDKGEAEEVNECND